MLNLITAISPVLGSFLKEKVPEEAVPGKDLISKISVVFFCISTIIGAILTSWYVVLPLAFIWLKKYREYLFCAIISFAISQFNATTGGLTLAYALIITGTLFGMKNNYKESVLQTAIILIAGIIGMIV